MVVIDPGHGGEDIGGGSNNYWLEKNLTLKISEYEYNRFKELGIPVAMTRYTDETLTPQERVNRAKAAFGANNNVILISNHINNDYGNFDGAEFIYSINDTPELANKLASDFKAAGQNVNRIFTRRNSAGNDFYYIIRDTYPMKSVIIEYGFADSKKDDIAQLRDNWQVLAEATVKAVAEYLGYPYKTDNTFYNYTVKKDDSLYKIANKTNTTVDELMKYNGLMGTVIYPNQIIKIPNNRSYDIYTTKPQETIESIAIKNNIPIDIILEKNNIYVYQLMPNQEIFIPKK